MFSTTAAASAVGINSCWAPTTWLPVTAPPTFPATVEMVKPTSAPVAATDRVPALSADAVAVNAALKVAAAFTAPVVPALLTNESVAFDAKNNAPIEVGEVDPASAVIVVGAKAPGVADDAAAVNAALMADAAETAPRLPPLLTGSSGATIVVSTAPLERAAVLAVSPAKPAADGEIKPTEPLGKTGARAVLAEVVGAPAELVAATADRRVLAVDVAELMEPAEVPAERAVLRVAAAVPTLLEPTTFEIPAARTGAAAAAVPLLTTAAAATAFAARADPVDAVLIVRVSDAETATAAAPTFDVPATASNVMFAPTEPAELAAETPARLNVLDGALTPVLVEPATALTPRPAATKSSRRRCDHWREWP